ncbi:hypothetical protein Taro_006977 [Colocasia esculenta]|uniref:Alpha/beta hydrolase fold-3 domain-containing protein n=1 Tax=Colocasia esculenta TaxID=4460 RepID=A0A843U2E3_COLES|nr:hypothetical protein [Colocasia esculenta]
MAATAADDSDAVVFEYLPFIRVYRDGRVERLKGTEVVPPSHGVDRATGVASKDVLLDPRTGVFARLYLPPLDGTAKLPVLVYFHGGGFCVETPFSPTFHGYLNSLAARARVVAVSVDYRLAPEHPLPAAYDDAWEALRWVAAHAGPGGGPEPWLVEHGDLGRVFVAGDSAGGNIAHNLAMHAGREALDNGVVLEGAVLVHPFFWGATPVGSEPADPAEHARAGRMWGFVCPSSAAGFGDPRVDPAAEGAPGLEGLGCRGVLVCTAGEDKFRARGRRYAEKVRECGGGAPAVEAFETAGEGHVFHLAMRGTQEEEELMSCLASFIRGSSSQGSQQRKPL